MLMLMLNPEEVSFKFEYHLLHNTANWLCVGAIGGYYNLLVCVMGVVFKLL